MNFAPSAREEGGGLGWLLGDSNLGYGVLLALPVLMSRLYQ
jgi:hypothetical protein